MSSNGKFFPMEDAEIHKNLPSGVYKLGVTREGQVYLEGMEVKHDKLIDLPSPEYVALTEELDYFLKPETKDKFQEMGFLYKRSALLYGVPGTGKTSLVNRIVQKVLAMNGVVLFDPHPAYLKKVFDFMDTIEPNRLLMIVFEEFDSTVDDSESELLSVLDGEVQKNNVIYVATTNFIEQIPPRILRPGRFSTLVEVKYPNADARRVYLRTKIKNADKVEALVSKTDGLSVDDLREVVLTTECLNQGADEVVKRIKDNKAKNEKNKRRGGMYD
jgi:ATP-dependent 26S proteasome regulatory subunit